MGADSSTAKNSNVSWTSRTVILNGLEVSPVYSPFIAKESVNISYSPAVVEKLKPRVTTVHNPRDIVQMIINCHDQIMNYPEVIEAIISASTKTDDPIIEILNTNFKEYIRYFLFRDSIFSANQVYRAQSIMLFNFTPKPECASTRMSFEKLLNAFKCCYSLLQKQDPPLDIYPVLEETTKFFDGALPPSSLTPPLENYCQRTFAHQDIFEGYQLRKHAICSNGSFLFILCSQTLIVYPLTENGSLSAPMTRIISRNFNDTMSMIATDKQLIIYDVIAKITLSIKDIIMGENKSMIQYTQENENTTGLYVSDGVTSIHVDALFKATPTVQGIKQPEVQLKRSIIRLNPAVPVCLPQTFINYSCITNGNFVGIIFPISRGQFLLRVFSLQTGEHVHDDLFSSSEDIIMATIDIVHRCYYIVHPLNNNRYTVRRYHFLGSDDPGMLDLFSYTSGLGLMQRKLKKFVKAVVGPTSTLIGSQIIPQLFIPRSAAHFIELIDLAQKILQLPSETITSAKDQIISVIQSMIAIIDANLLLIKRGTIDTKEIRTKLLELITLLPTNLAVHLFFNNIDYFFTGDVNFATSIMVGLYQRIKWEPLFSYAINALESSIALSLVPFSTPNQLTELIPQNVTLLSNTPPSIVRLLIVHQRILVSQAAIHLKKEPFADVSFVARTRSSTPNPLDNFGDYLQIIVTKFDSALSMSFSPEELQNSLIFLLFDNFIRLISNLVEFHSIARVTTALISVLLSKISDFISTKIQRLEDFSQIANLVLTLLFAYGKFASTLVKGGGLSEFESKCMWLMRANIDLIDHPDEIINLDSHELDGINNTNLTDFLKAENPEPMKLIYKKHKAPFHKNLSEALKRLDRTVLAATCKHMELLDELLALNSTSTLTPSMKKAADQMIKVRNVYRSLTQNQKNDQAELIYHRALMLLRMASNFLPTDKRENLISEFLTSNFSPEYVKTIIKQQRTRVQVTLVGFALIDRTYTMQIHPLLNNIIAYTLSNIESFEGLAVIMRITQLKEGQIEQMKQFFNRILQMIETTHNDRLTLIAMRFFRDINNVSEIQKEFLLKVFNSIQYDSMFALALSLISVLDKVPENFLGPTATPAQLTFTAEIFKKVQGNDEVFKNFSQRLISESSPLNARIIGRVIQQLFNQPTISNEAFEEFIKAAITRIGESFVNFTQIEVVSEIINILRIAINRNFKIKEQLIKTITSITPESNEYDVAGVFAILSNFLEPLHPYCNARFHKDRNTSTEVICIPTTNPKEFIIYQKPFSLDEGSQRVKVEAPAFIYAVPLNQINQKIFNNYQWILSFFDATIKENRYSNITQSIYVQVVAHFMKEPEFMKLITQDQIDEFCVSPVPFGDITDTLKAATDFFNKPSIQQIKGFNQLTYMQSPTITLLSPQIKPDEKFSVTFYTSADRMRGFIGICSDTVEGFSARYALAELPSGTLYPAVDKMRKLKPAQKYTMNVDMSSRTFTIGDNKYEFPMGKKFRVLMAVNNNMPIEIECDMSHFDPTAFSPLQEHAALDFDYNGILFKEPAWLDSIKDIPESIDTIPELDVDVAPVSYKERMRRNFIMPINTILIHPQFATQASREICMEAFKGLFRQIACQWMTIALVRVAAARPEMIRNEKVIVKLFSILSVLLEQFYPNEFINGKFPFSLDEPIWDERATTNLLYLSLDIESKNAMKELSKRPDVQVAVGKCIKAMASDPYLHLIAYPNKAHSYKPPGTANPTERIRSSAIITVNSFTGQIPEFFTSNNKKLDSPATAYYPIDIKLRIDPSAFALSIFNVSPMNNSWIFETPFEMLILLKSFISMCSTNEGRIIAKSAIIDSLVAASPFILNYIPEFLELLQVTIPTTPLDYYTSYKKKLLLMASAIKQMTPSTKERMKIVYSHEQRVLISKMAAELSCHFPEFFNSEIPKPQSDFCMIPHTIIDPGAITEGFMAHILMIRLFARKYTTLVGFPFWEILPLWYRISGFYKGNSDYIKPELRYVQGNFLRFTNPSKMNVTINITVKQGQRLPPDAIITRAKTDSFEDPVYMMYSDIGRPIITKDETMYFSLIAIPQGWNAFKVGFTLNEAAPKKNSNERIKVNVSEVHEQFISDMKEFAVKWNDEDTDTLLNVLPRNALQMPTFSTIESIAKQSTLSMRYSPTVVSLRALLIHHFNYIKLTHRSDIPDAVWGSLSKFVSCEDASDEFVRAVAKSGQTDFPELTIDRHTAHRLILDGKGNPNFCIIHQLATAFARVGPNALRCPTRPWKVRFVGEEAIDAGGPGRELMTEAAASIFEPTSQLTYQTPNARHKVGQFLDVFIPFDQTGKRQEDFRAIGTYLGIVVRTGLVQDLPFAPFVFKFLAGGELNNNDVTQVDNTLVEQFKHLREAEAAGDFQRCAVPWNIEQWDGTTAMLPGHSAEALVGEGEVEAYINECINFRINSLRPTLLAMRDGFVENIRVESHPLLTGSRLSHMTQGSNVITTQQLRSITVVSDFSGLDDPYIVRFFKAVDRLNADQRKMLLKFITTLTRLPNSSINPNFVIKIDRLVRQNPDESLPTASTCFNKLHLPAYTSEEICYQRLLVAIQYCQTMENR